MRGQSFANVNDQFLPCRTGKWLSLFVFINLSVKSELRPAGSFGFEGALAGLVSSVVQACGLSCPAACWILVPWQGSNPCLLHFQVDS